MKMIKSKVTVLLSIIIFIALITGCTKPQEYDLAVEGIHYLTNHPVRIEIKDGKISRICDIKKLNDYSSTPV